MSGSALGGHANPHRSLLGDRDRVVTMMPWRLLYSSALVEQVSGVRVHPLFVVDEPFGAVASALLLIGGGDEDDVAIEQDARALDREHRHHLDHARTLVVDRAAAPDVAVPDLARKRRHLPLLRYRRDDVHVAQ